MRQYLGHLEYKCECGWEGNGEQLIKNGSATYNDDWFECPQCRRDGSSIHHKGNKTGICWLPMPRYLPGMRVEDKATQDAITNWIEEMQKLGYVCLCFNPYGNSLFRKD